MIPPNRSARSQEEISVTSDIAYSVLPFDIMDAFDDTSCGHLQKELLTCGDIDRN